MTKSELVSAIAEESGLTKTDAAAALDATVSVITNALSKGDQVTIIGFGTFKVGERYARTGRNPQTGEVIKIARKNVVKLKVGKALQDAVFAPKK